MDTILLANFSGNQTTRPDFRQNGFVFNTNHFGCFFGAKGDAGYFLRMSFHFKERVFFIFFGNFFPARFQFFSQTPAFCELSIHFWAKLLFRHPMHVLEKGGKF